MGKRKTSPSSFRTSRSVSSPHLYTLQVFLIGGPVGEKFGGQVISRKIQIRGDQTLHDLHLVIFKAYDREEEHMYEFNLGKSPRDRSRLYIFSGVFDQMEDSCGDPQETTLDSLGLKEGQHFGYTFDFGDNWAHELEVSAIETGPYTGKYPKIIEKVGASPPQYPDFEEEDE